MAGGGGGGAWWDGRNGHPGTVVARWLKTAGDLCWEDYEVNDAGDDVVVVVWCYGVLEWCGVVKAVLCCVLEQ